MKTLRFFLFVTFCTFAQHLFSQSATSIANGPWVSPFTWSCTCVPLPGYTVTINHQVTLNTSFQLPSGGITINAGGALVQDSARDMLINGGYIVNHGTVDFRYLLLQSGHVTSTDSLRLKSFANYGTIENSGVLHRVDSFLNVGFIHNTGLVLTKRFQNNDTLINDGLFAGVDSFFNLSFILNNDSIVAPTFLTTGNLINNGHITGVDSFTNTGMLANNATGVIDAHSMLNSGTVINHGVLHTTAFASLGNIQNAGGLTFYDAYNLYLFTNTGFLTGAHSLLNTGRFVNAVGGNVQLGGSFKNIDSLYHDAAFINDGVLQVDSDWYNADTVAGGFGSFTVALLSGNSGRMNGSFDFCDLTPPASAPFVDNNTGTISPQITWCTPQAPHANLSAADVCDGQPLAFTNTSTGTITSFFWNFDDGDTSTLTSPEHTYSSSGTYNVMLVAGNGLSADTGYLTVTVYPLPATSMITVNGSSVSCSAVAAGYTWYLNGVLQSSITTQSFVVTQQGYYSVKVTDVHSCSSAKSDSVFVTIVSGLGLLQSESTVQIFPNPFVEKTTILISAAENLAATLSVFDIHGRQVLTGTGRIEHGNAHQLTIDLAKEVSGVYLYQLRLGSKLYCGKLVRE
ncbi:MAG: PKD domain-containing protein [Chitinophagales bacterium]|jgi:PKD repeat protein|nr:PKD domain-containing protein [Chitinophagales bacterium]